MTNLTPAQQKEVKVLVRLGDSFELAIKTVLGKKEISQEAYDFYKSAYEA